VDDDYEAGQRLDPNESSIAATGASCLKAGLDRSPDAGALKRTALPAWIKPQLTQPVGQPPDEPEWLHELKFDGYRMHARLDRGAVLTRRKSAETMRAALLTNRPQNVITPEMY
jgi:ATP-dependent DNA ligase